MGNQPSRNLKPDNNDNPVTLAVIPKEKQKLKILFSPQAAVLTFDNFK